MFSSFKGKSSGTIISTTRQVDALRDLSGSSPPQETSFATMQNSFFYPLSSLIAARVVSVCLGTFTHLIRASIEARLCQFKKRFDENFIL